MDSGSGGSSSDPSDTIVAPAEPAPDNSNNDDSTDDNGDDSGKTEPAEPKPDTPDDSETTTEIDSNTDMSKLNPTKKYIFKATDGTVDAAKLVYAKKILGENLSFTETDVNYTLDFSNKSFSNTTDEIESRSEYASKKGLTSSTSIITDENLTETIKIADVEFITKPIFYKGDNDKVIQQAFKFGKNVDNVKVTFGNEHSMTEAYKGGIILENSNAKIISTDVNSATLTGYVYTETMDELSDNSLMSKLAKDSDFLPTLNFDFVSLSGNNNFYSTGVDKIFENYYKKASRLQLTEDASNVFDAEKYLNGRYMYSEDGNYNNNAYDIDINIALLMAEKLTRKIENVNVSGSITSDKDTTLNPSNVRFSGDVSGLNFTATAGNGIIDFASVGPKEIVAPSSKIIVNGVKNDTNTKIIAGRVVDFSGVEETLLKYLDASSSYVRTIYTKSGSFSGTQHVDTTFKTGSSASTNRAWEEAGRNGTLPSDSLSKLDVKAKADNPLLQKLLDENRPVYS
ncbi:MAG: hypothetical protein MR771_10350 [Treponema succinifaciens]|uniref:hypothetical protein n=1 Tax=Treponema succinifaciens TaxID=167 RepID=UPI002354CC8F|nr:hypothetical protein [Treponema succinifaciens]MCI6913551.1 hypothetical protein [Treponema succinifaciens]